MTVRPGRKPASKTHPIPLRLEDFAYAEDLQIALPQLVLGIEISKRDLSEESTFGYQFKPGRIWLKLVHQTAGHACHQRYLICTLLTPKSPKIAQGLAALDRKWIDSQAGCFGVSLGQAVGYDADLRSLLGAGCNDSHHHFEEGFMPLDTRFVPEVAADTLPQDLDELIEWRNGFERMGGSIGRWRVAVLGQNSD